MAVQRKRTEREYYSLAAGVVATMLISLIIPTRERCQYLRESIRTALAIQDDQIEVLVSDNCSTDETQRVAETISDARFRYLNTGQRLSMRQNFEFALQQSRGEYVFYIGDDDGFLPGQFAALRRILEQHRPDIFSWYPLTYQWPGENSGSGRMRMEAGRLFGQPRFTDVSDACVSLQSARLTRLTFPPAVYHGCASREWLTQIRTKDDCVFGGRIPDVYITYTAILRSARCLFSKHPFSINGISSASTGNAHHAFRKGDPRASPARRFGDELRNDPVQDAVKGYAPSIPVNLFSTYETARRNCGVDPATTDYSAWYRYVLQGSQVSAGIVDPDVAGILKEYAAQTGTESQLQAASGRSILGSVAVRMERTWNKFRSKIRSVKISAEQNGLNNIYTATTAADLFLGDLQLQLLNGQRQSFNWSNAKSEGLSRLAQSIN
ncbi:MAG: glycosyltransferase family 2 protein [Planctomycetaceae bacterium]|nr:glycosyltransferase family 2 protein [Planctomycetaceae bacterium]